MICGYNGINESRIHGESHMIQETIIQNSHFDELSTGFRKITPMQRTRYVPFPARNVCVHGLCARKINFMARGPRELNRSVFKSIADQKLSACEKEHGPSCKVTHLDDREMGKQVQMRQAQRWRSQLREHAMKHFVPFTIHSFDIFCRYPGKLTCEYVARMAGTSTDLARIYQEIVWAAVFAFESEKDVAMILSARALKVEPPMAEFNMTTSVAKFFIIPRVLMLVHFSNEKELQ